MLIAFEFDFPLSAVPGRSAARAGGVKGSATRRAAAAGRRGRRAGEDAAARGHGHARPPRALLMSVIAAAEALLAPDLELHAEVLALAAAQERRHGAAFDRALARFASDQFRAKSCARARASSSLRARPTSTPRTPAASTTRAASCTSSRRAVAPR